jgi:hypothetical protein
MAWDKTKPAGGSKLSSAEHRANYLALARTLGGGNLVDDARFDIWAAGDAAVPTCYKVASGSPTIARCGTGLGDTARKVGPFCLKVTAGAAQVIIQQLLLTTGDFDDSFKAQPFNFGVWAKCANASKASMQLVDGVNTTASALNLTTDWEWLVPTTHHAVSDTGTYLGFQLVVAANQTVYFSGPTILFGEVAPEFALPSLWTDGTLYFPQASTVVVGNAKGGFAPTTPGIITHCQLNVLTAPTSAALIAGVDTWDGSAFQAVFSSQPQIAATATVGGAAPDGTYRYRCLSWQFNNDAPAAGSLLRFNVTQVGSGVAGSDLRAYVRARQLRNPLASFRAYDHYKQAVA